MFLERLLDRQLEGRSGGGAAVTAPLQGKPRDPFLDSDQLHVPAVRLHVRPYGAERLEHALLERHRVQVVDQQQAGDRTVLRELVKDRRARLASGLDRLDDPPQPVAVHRDHGRHERLGELPRLRIGQLLDPGRELLDAFEQLSWVGHASAVGVWMTFLTRPLPVYMCTPHGRQGSKLRTARMMSTPLKFSALFSSKIGVFWTASS